MMPDLTPMGINLIAQVFRAGLYLLGILLMLRIFVDSLMALRAARAEGRPDDSHGYRWAMVMSACWIIEFTAIGLERSGFGLLSWVAVAEDKSSNFALAVQYHVIPELVAFVTIVLAIVIPTQLIILYGGIRAILTDPWARGSILFAGMIVVGVLYFCRIPT